MQYPCLTLICQGPDDTYLKRNAMVAVRWAAVEVGVVVLSVLTTGAGLGPLLVAVRRLEFR